MAEFVTGNALQGYAAAAAELIERFENVSSAQLFKPVADFLPKQASTILDIGAGTGRDAAWLAEQGHKVLAVEPVDELRKAGIARHTSQRIEWLNDQLPDLQSLRARKCCFDYLFLSAVWQHLEYDERLTAMHSLSELTARGGMIIMSLRHGPGDPTRPVYEPRVKDTIAAALQRGLTLMRECVAPSIQSTNRAAGVHWTWLAFGMPST